MFGLQRLSRNFGLSAVLSTGSVAAAILLIPGVSNAVPTGAKFGASFTDGVVTMRISLNRPPTPRCTARIYGRGHHETEEASATDSQFLKRVTLTKRRTLLITAALPGVLDSDLGNPAIVSLGAHISCKGDKDNGKQVFDTPFKAFYAVCGNTSPRTTFGKFFKRFRRLLDVAEASRAVVSSAALVSNCSRENAAQ